MMFRLFKTSPGAVPDSVFKTVSLYFILAGIVLMLLAALSAGVWGSWSTVLLPHLSTKWLVWGVRGIGLGCMGLMVHDIARFIKCQWQKYNARKGGTR
ncbi:MAG TPA: hypothetical protein VGH05_03905 [Buttiauxella sp.]|jgi:hypothetical protein